MSYQVQQGRCPTCRQLVVQPPNEVRCDICRMEEGVDCPATYSVAVAPSEVDGFVAGNYCAKHLLTGLGTAAATGRKVEAVPITQLLKGGQR